MFQCLAVDIGAGSGRIMRCVIDDNKKITLDEIARFGNESREKNGFLRWNITQLVSDIKAGLAKAAALGKPDAIAVDTWGVDYVMLDIKLADRNLHKKYTGVYLYGNFKRYHPAAGWFGYVPLWH